MSSVHMASPLPDDVKECAIALKAAQLVKGSEGPHALKAELPRTNIRASAVPSKSEDSMHRSEPAETVKHASSHNTESTKPEASVWPIEIVNIPGKGKGIIASRDIKPGELVIAEAALLTVEWVAPPASVLSAVAALSPEERAGFYALHRCGIHPGGVERDIVLMNNLLTGERHGIFLTTSRFNHSCRPNMKATWSSVLNKQVLYALRPIKKGEDLCYSYIDPRQTRQLRHKMLIEQYGFTCRCEACELESATLKESDARRMLLCSINVFLETGLAEQPHAKLNTIERAVAFLRMEELYGLDFDYLAPGYLIHYSVLKNMEEAKKWAAWTYKAARIANGKGSPRAVLYKGFMTKPGDPGNSDEEKAVTEFMRRMQRMSKTVC